MGVAMIVANCKAAVTPAAIAKPGPANGVANAAMTAAAPPMIAFAIANAFWRLAASYSSSAIL